MIKKRNYQACIRSITKYNKGIKIFFLYHANDYIYMCSL